MASFTYRGVHVELQPAGYGFYRATANYANDKKFSVISHNFAEWVDRLNFPDSYTKKEIQEAKRAIYSIIQHQRNNK